MTQIRNLEKKCSVCGETSMYPVLMSTNCWGYPDLDFRPAEMQRSTMNTWLDECPHCGYVARNIEHELNISPEILKTDEYLTCEGKDFKNNLSKRFYRSYLISKARNDYVSAFYMLLYCAWKCDDSQDELAVEIRKLAVAMLENIDAEDDDEKNRLQLIRADLLRRSLQFERLIEEYDDFKIEDEIMYSVIRFQLERAAKKDSACYTVEDVVEEFNLKH